MRQAQIERAEKMVSSKSVKKQRKNPNDPARFVKVTAVTSDGEIVARADVNGDGEVGIGDIVAITNIMAGR